MLGTDFIKAYGEFNPERFNRKFILMKKEDMGNILEYMDDVCRSMETIEGVTYLGSTLESDESSILLSHKSQEVSVSRQATVTVKFKIESRDERLKKDSMEVLEIPIYVPKLIDNYYFTFNGSNYFPIYQLVDKSTYVIGFGDKRRLALKTLLMPVIIEQEKYSYIFSSDSEEVEVEGRAFFIKLFSKRPNFLYYYFAKFGLEGTIEYFGMQDIIKLTNVKEGTSTFDKEVEDKFVYSFSPTLHLL